MTSRSRSERDEDMDDAEGLPDLKKMCIRESDFVILNILDSLVEVTNWRDLGVQLGLKPARLKALEEYPEDQRKLKMILQWLKADQDASWEKLQAALEKPALCENRAAKSIAEKRRGSSFDSHSVISIQSRKTSISEDTEFNEANVRNAIAHVKDTKLLGEQLKIPPSILVDIDKHPPDMQKHHLVEALFRVCTDTDCDWKILEEAIRFVEIYEWISDRRSSSFKSQSGSFSAEDVPMSPPHSNGSGNHSIDQADLRAPKVAERKNDKMILENFTKLKMKIIKNLTEAKLDMDDFHDFIESLFETGDSIPKDYTVKQVFKELDKLKYWNFLDTTGLESIIEMFDEDHEAQNMKMIKEYKEKLAGYKAATRITDFIQRTKKSMEEAGQEYQSIKGDEEKYDEKYRSKLSIKLFGEEAPVKLGMESLEYVEKLWDSLCIEFHMPSLPRLLDSIIIGSIIINWLIRHAHVMKVLERVHSAVHFFGRKFIASVSIEMVCIYDHDKGVAEQKVLNYIKLLIKGQEANDEQTRLTLTHYFPDINAPINETGRTALMFAAQHNHRVLFEFLRNQGADTYLLDNDGMSIISLSEPHEDFHNQIVDTFEEKLFTVAKEGGDLSLLEKLFKIGVNINALEKDEFQWTPLLWACENGHEDVVDYLLEHNADPNAQDKKNWTGLILASRNGYAGIVRRLLDKGADVNKETDSKWTSLQWTAQEGHTEVARMLLDKGARTEVEDEDGYSPLLQASQDGHLEIVKLLFEYNPEIDANKPTPDDWSALLMAAKNGHEAIMQFLVDHGANVNHKKEEDGVTALHVCSYNGRNNIVRNLCLKQKEKINVNIQDDFGNTPLIFAAKQKKLDVVKTLVGNGHADVNVAEEKTNWTALFFAVQNNGQEIVEYLLETQKVDLKHKDKEGNTVIDVAKEINPEALEYLSKHFPAETEEVLSKKTSITMTMKQGKATYYWTDMINNMDLRMTAPPKRGMAAAA